jgi:hypothetical protein
VPCSPSRQYQRRLALTPDTWRSRWSSRDVVSDPRQPGVFSCTICLLLSCWSVHWRVSRLPTTQSENSERILRVSHGTLACYQHQCNIGCAWLQPSPHCSSIRAKQIAQHVAAGCCVYAVCTVTGTMPCGCIDCWTGRPALNAFHAAHAVAASDNRFLWPFWKTLIRQVSCIKCICRSL